MTAEPRVVALLHCGELGAAIASLLLADGHRVLTATGGRSDRTRQRAEEVGVEIVEHDARLFEAADVVLSVVPPASAVAVAEQMSAAGAGSTVYVDLNSIDVESSARIRNIVEAAGHDYVAGSVHGSSARFAESGAVYLSGPGAEAIAPLFGRVDRVETLGDSFELAKSMKLLLAGMSKGLSMLYVEVATIAQRSGIIDEFDVELRSFYPELAEFIGRSVPTYARHGRRRIDEIAAVEHLAAAAGVGHDMLAAARRSLEGNWETWAELREPHTSTDLVRSASSRPLGQEVEPK